MPQTRGFVLRGHIPVDPKASKSNRTFFAVAYNAEASGKNVRFYFDDARRQADLDATSDYTKGPVGSNIGPLTIIMMTTQALPQN